MNLQDATKLAHEKMNEHGLLDQGWILRFSSAKRAFGACYYSRKVIKLSRYLVSLNDETSVLNTILHEIAHALAGPQHHHNHYWKAVAKHIGCDGSRCYDSTQVMRPESRYRLTCPNCDRQIRRHRRPKAQACSVCCNKYNHGQYTEKFRFIVIDTKRKEY